MGLIGNNGEPGGIIRQTTLGYFDVVLCNQKLRVAHGAGAALGPDSYALPANSGGVRDLPLAGLVLGSLVFSNADGTMRYCDDVGSLFLSRVDGDASITALRIKVEGENQFGERVGEIVNLTSGVPQHTLYCYRRAKMTIFEIAGAGAGDTISVEINNNQRKIPIPRGIPDQSIPWVQVLERPSAGLGSVKNGAIAVDTQRGTLTLGNTVGNFLDDTTPNPRPSSVTARVYFSAGEERV